MRKKTAKLYNIFYKIVDRIIPNFADYYVDRKNNLIFWTCNDVGKLLHPMQSIMFGINVTENKKKIKSFLCEFVMKNNFEVSNSITKEHIMSNIYENLDYLDIEVFVNLTKVNYNKFQLEIGSKIEAFNNLNDFTKKVQSKLVELKNYLVNTDFYHFDRFLDELFKN